jgi:putative transposase
MPRANRYVVAGELLHITNRCHDRAFLLRFARDRDTYRSWLREGVRRTGVSVLDYIITSNHVHIVAESGRSSEIADLMRLAEGCCGEQYNRRKGRSGAFWEDRYGATIIDSGPYLWDCMVYVDLNMVRAGVVGRPEEWEWGGYRELMGLRRRYRLVDLDRVVELTGAGSIEAFRDSYGAAVADTARGDLAREPRWTESVAVGRREFVDRIRSSVDRRETEIEAYGEGAPGTAGWVLRERSP